MLRKIRNLYNGFNESSWSFKQVSLASILYWPLFNKSSDLDLDL